MKTICNINQEDALLTSNIVEIKETTMSFKRKKKKKKSKSNARTKSLEN
jgi:hypothetical protein